MKTLVPKADEIKRDWWIVDAKDQILGQIATKIADKLRGKDKPIFTPYLDCGDFVIVINCEKVKLTGQKLDKKMYYHHTGFPGGIREASAKVMLEKHPDQVISLAVNGMLPKNKLRKPFMTKLHVYVGETHPHTAQTPKKLEI